VRPLPTSLAAALAAWLAVPAWAQTSEFGEPVQLRMSPLLQPPVRGDAANRLPIVLRAQSLSGSPDGDTVAEGNAEFRRGGTVIRADRLSYNMPDDLAKALGNVRISRDGNTYAGPELQLKVQRFEGFFAQPVYHFGRADAGGSAQRVDFIDEQRAVATSATYTSCPADDSGTPAWLLTTDRVTLDFGTNEGVAEGAVLRFYGVPILAGPTLSFPLTDERKSGWLPPSIGLDTTSGLMTSIPYYWNIAPNRDATFVPSISTRRGAALGSEFRYLEPSFDGVLRANTMPRDRIAGRERYAFGGLHHSDFGNELRLQLDLLRVSDNDYWKDFPGDTASLTPRLLASGLKLAKPWGDWTGYANVQAWQVLQATDPASRIDAPYQRVPQVGARYGARVGPGFEINFESEFNRFTSPTDPSIVTDPTNPLYVQRVGGMRVHALGSASWPYVTPGWTLTPKLLFNAAAYSLDQATSTLAGRSSRVIPSMSLDSAWVFERETEYFGRAARQTLEPRLYYVNTRYHDPAGQPNFDSSPKDFNFDSIFTENAFSGVDRVSDAHQVTAGLATRVFDPETGAERLRLGVAQRYLLRDQLVTPDDKPLTQRFSDVLLLGSTTLVPAWTLDASLQYRPETSRVTRSMVGARYSPGPFRTVSATYRLMRGASEQVEVGWQWPIYGNTPDEARAAKRAGASEGSGGCTGSWYGVGHFNYSMSENRLIDAVVGVEYDAGCWIGRIVATRLSTGYSEATTRVALQLEFVGLSRLSLGSNPLQVLKDNIPGFRLLREGRTVGPSSSAYD
jgi:LPS-assembly protein